MTVTFWVQPVLVFIWQPQTATSYKFVNQIVKILDNNKFCWAGAERTMSVRQKQGRRRGYRETVREAFNVAF